MRDAFQTCPCGTGQPYAACCGPLHAGEPAPTAERLMRSRYSAFALGDEDHLFRTWHPRTRPDVLSLPAVTWTGLEIVDATEDTVEFVARSEDATGRRHEQREVSRFERRAGRWVYVDGVTS